MSINNKASWFSSRACFQKIVLLIVLLTMSYSSAIAGDGLEWERFRIIPLLNISESYSSNIYRVEENKTEDYITEVTPEVTFDVAVLPKNYFSLKYRGNFFSYADASNFKDSHHSGSLSFNSETAKGSHIVIGVSGEDTAIQPYSEQDQSKDYTSQSAYTDILLAIGKVTEIGTEFSHTEREFDEFQYADDEYSREQWDLHVLYKRSVIFPLLMQYRYIDQDNNDRGAVTTDFQSHTMFIGARWRPGGRLSGALRLGYMRAQFDESDGDDYYGYAVDTNLVYAFSEITRFTLALESSIQQPTKSARESGDYYVYTNTGFYITHRKWERITTRLNFLYRNRDYTMIQGSQSLRVDDYYQAGLSIAWAPRDWISFSLGYRYQQNFSNYTDEEYTENLIKLGITLSM